uniref:Uncharacterized protein n=1 Tax=Anguilla anguilla TaxID=7936 RepID=A0A0E9Y0X3_ANGAN
MKEFDGKYCLTDYGYDSVFFLVCLFIRGFPISHF